MGKIIEVKNLFKLYRVGDSVVHALNGVNFSINEGEFCAIVGTSGSGKSTLLNMLAGLEKPTKGEVIINGEHMEKLKEDQLVSFRRDHVGFIFQSFHLINSLNVTDNVELPLLYRRVGSSERKRLAQEVLEKVGLSHRMRHFPTQLSGGQCQRVAIARAIIGNPEIILADEPTGALDSRTGREVMLFLQKLNAEGNTIILITHDNSIAAKAKRIIRITDGRIVYDGPAEGDVTVMNQHGAGEEAPEDERAKGAT